MSDVLTIFGQEDAQLGAVTGPSNVVNEELAAKDPHVAYSLINARWNEAIPWFASNGGLQQFPEVSEFIKSWRDFSQRWSDSWSFFGSSFLQPTDELAAAAKNVASAESHLTRRGYTVPRLAIADDGSVALSAEEVGKSTGARSPSASPLGTPPKGPDVTIKAPATPSEATLHPIAKTIDRIVPDLPFATKQDKKSKSDPNVGIKIGAVAALSVATILTAATSKSDTARAGFALLGSVLTIATGALLFGSTPASDKKTEEKKT